MNTDTSIEPATIQQANEARDLMLAARVRADKAREVWNTLSKLCAENLEAFRSGKGNAETYVASRDSLARATATYNSTARDSTEADSNFEKALSAITPSSWSSFRSKKP